MSGSSFIAYTIQTDIPAVGTTFEAKHRYSEFEGLRKLLAKIHPTVIVPPIPEKHNIKDYASKPGKAKENPSIIDKRKRLLQAFLNRVAAHPVLRGEHIYHRFIRGEGSWTEILADSGLSFHLKKKDTVVNVSERASLKNPGRYNSQLDDKHLKSWNKDQQFVAAEDYTNRFALQTAFIRRIYKDIHKDYEDMTGMSSELGTIYNGWSLTEDRMSEAIEQIGQAIDITTVANQSLANSIQSSMGTTLKEYGQFSKVIDKLLRWRHKKHIEFETLSESLVTNQTNLGKLESSEHESQRLAAVLNAEGAVYTPPSGSR